MPQTTPARRATTAGRATTEETRDAVEVANRLRPVLLQLSRHLRREVGSSGVTSGQLTLLGVIHGDPGVGVGDLAAREAMSAPALCGHIDRLEAAGLVARERAADGDRRRVGLRVTDAGVAALLEARSRRTAWLADRLRDIPAEDLALIDASVDAMTRVLERDRGPARR